MWLPASIKMHHKFVLGWEVYLDTEAIQNTVHIKFLPYELCMISWHNCAQENFL